MNKRIILALVASALGCMAIPVLAQMETEIYIPIGQSPGLSKEHTVIGEIVEVDTRQRVFEVKSESGRQSVTVKESTRIWRDRSKAKAKNVTGNYSDCKVGDRVEIKFVDAKRKQVADWIKVEAD